MQQLELGPRPDDEGVAVLAEQEHAAVVGPRRGGEPGAGADAGAAVDLAAGAGVVAQQEPAVEQRVVGAPVDEGRGVVGAQHRLVPDDVVVAAVARCERDVARRAGPDGVDGPRHAAGVARADVDETVAGERGGDDVDGHAADVPQLAAGEVVGPHPAPAGRDDLGPDVVLPHEGARPVLVLVALDAPDRVAGAGVEREEERAGGVVVDDVEPPVVEGRRGGGAEALPAVEDADLAGPDHVPVEVEGGDEADRPEVDVEALAVGDRGFRREAVLDVTLDGGHRRGELARPADLAGLEGDVADEEPVLGRGRGGPEVGPGVVEPRLRRRLVAGADRGGHPDVVVPDDGRAPAEARHVGGPDDVLGLAPGLGQPGVVGDRAGGGAAEPRPLVRLGRRGGGER